MDSDDSFSENSFIDDTDLIDVEEEKINKLKEEKLDYEVIKSDEIVEEMNSYIEEVKSTMNISRERAKILLNLFNWDKDELIIKYFDGSNKKLFVQAEIDNKSKSKKSKDNKSSARNQSEKKNECEVCCLPVESSHMVGLRCDHMFCIDCWEMYLKTQIRSNGAADSIQCAAHNCKVLIDDEIVEKLLKNNRDRALYQRLITKNFVESNKMLQWCPSPYCENIIKVLFVVAQPVTCDCETTFCFSCAKDWHDPVQCLHFGMWLKKIQDESETCKWIVCNTKDCPKCKIPIEKNGGCNHMSCINPKCNYEFCWLCMESWNGHNGDFNRCNNYRPTLVNIKNKEKEKFRFELNRYLFYVNRYSSHRESLDFEYRLKDIVHEKMSALQDKHMKNWVDVQFLAKAVDTLRVCRQTLMYTYVFAFYSKKNLQMEIFEENQNDLQMAVENLSGTLERELEYESLDKLQQKIQNNTRYCNLRRQTLLDHVHEGNELDWWQYDYTY